MFEIIRSNYLNHNGGIYIYRLHDEKIDRLCNDKFSNLQKYLNAVFNKCPDNYFNYGPRSSSLKFKLPVDLIEINGHEVSTLAKYGLEENKDRFTSAHPMVQNFMIENDNSTIAMEVPLWITKHDLVDYEQIMKTNDPLTGHIDVLRIEDDRIWVWDYKPSANKEKYATTQVYFYAIMLSKRTGISLDNFRCGYFDHRYAYLFKPIEDVIMRTVPLTKFI